MRVVRVNELRLHAEITGDPHGLPVVFANSLGTDLRVWDPLLPHLPAGLKIIRYDMRGHGLSDRPDGDYWMGDLVADAAGLMDALDIRGAVFVGLSIGGVVAQGLAAERPDLVRAAVLSNTAAKIGTESTWRDRIATVRRGGIEAIADGVMEKWFTRAFHATRADELALWRHMLTRTPLEGYCGCCAALSHTDLREFDRRPPPAGPGHRRLRRRLDPARPRARDRRNHPRRPLRDHPRRRPHPSRRGARGDGAVARPLPEGARPWLSDTTPA